ncbi:hypothetical protein [Fuerstiella marisgermanici]|uniref:Uncharacterized protein n=1 Tax=Fuerstiella marisgermanici TaxID=1891926 RepID=A0A1P8W9N2_9PLAN|nr:hypothetical protein [Fuerstiella marisgermanici]APZ90765.1 hypothetical protein Fuma_00349 [Fuerstiella marisgermanici]
MSQTTESLLHFQCSNGHKIRADVRHEGRRSKCPVCSVAVTVGGKPSTTVAPITDSGVCRLLSELDADAAYVGTAQPSSVNFSAPSVPAEIAATHKHNHKHCPRCTYPMESNQRVCPDCKLLLESSRSPFKRIYRAAMRSLSR